MSIGVIEAGGQLEIAVNVRLAIDLWLPAVSVFERNVCPELSLCCDVEEIFPGILGSGMQPSERTIFDEVGVPDLLIGGPPCQGHSNLNNHTRRNDPRNAHYSRMARAAEILRPKVVVIENVPAVQWDKSGVVNESGSFLREIGYEVESVVLDMTQLGVPQRRKRHVLLASRVGDVDPEKVLQTLAERRIDSVRSVRWAIGDLRRKKGKTTFDTSATPSAENQRRMNFLFANELFDLPDSERPLCHRDGNHSYRSVYGRMSWDSPAQTVTSGFGSMGQGRYVHPEFARTITPHEAARLQTFPDWFDWAGIGRTDLATLIANAVPPLLTMRLAELVLPSLV
jgi:DNA (cytosine-5)-methyltransferase 1